LFPKTRISVYFLEISLFCIVPKDMPIFYGFVWICLDLPMLTRGYLKEESDLIYLLKSNQIRISKMWSFRVSCLVSLVFYLWATLVSSWCYSRTVLVELYLWFTQELLCVSKGYLCLGVCLHHLIVIVCKHRCLCCLKEVRRDVSYLGVPR
jgi:hypothetical protein